MCHTFLRSSSKPGILNNWGWWWGWHTFRREDLKDCHLTRGTVISSPTFEREKSACELVVVVCYHPPFGGGGGGPLGPLLFLLTPLFCRGVPRSEVRKKVTVKEEKKTRNPFRFFWLILGDFRQIISHFSALQQNGVKKREEFFSRIKKCKETKSALKKQKPATTKNR